MTPPPFYPHPEQELLLAAALLPGTEAIAAWAEWHARVNFERKQWDVGSFRLLPLVYRTLQQNGTDDPVMDRLKGIYRRAWTEGQLQQQVGAGVVAALQDAGIPALLLQSPPTAVEEHPLPSADTDLLVRPEQIPTAIALLTRRGWQPVGRAPEQLTPAARQIRPSQPFANAQGRTVTLHWRALGDWQGNGGDETFWTETRSLSVSDRTVQVLQPAHQIARLATLACAWAPLPRYDRLAEMVLLLRRAEDGKDGVDWERLVQVSQQHRVALPVRASLAYLNRLFVGTAPDASMERLGQISVSGVEERLFRALARPPHLPGQFGHAWQFYQRYHAQAAAGVLGEKPGGFIGYTQLHAGTPALSGFLRWSVRKLLRTS